MATYKVFRRTKSGLKFDTNINGRTWKLAWLKNKRAGQFTSGKYVVEDKRGKNRFVSV